MFLELVFFFGGVIIVWELSNTSLPLFIRRYSYY